MTELKTLIKENASLIGELKYNVKEKQKAIEMLLEQLSREGEKVFELVYALETAISCMSGYEELQGWLKQIKQALAKVEGKE